MHLTRIWQFCTIESLGLETLIEPQIGHADAEPGHQAGDGGHVLEPSEDCVGPGSDAHEGEKCESDGDEEGSPRKATFAGTFEDLRGISGDGKTICDSGSELLRIFVFHIDAYKEHESWYTYH